MKLRYIGSASPFSQASLAALTSSSGLKKPIMGDLEMSEMAGTTATTALSLGSFTPATDMYDPPPQMPSPAILSLSTKGRVSRKSTALSMSFSFTSGSSSPRGVPWLSPRYEPSKHRVTYPASVSLPA